MIWKTAEELDLELAKRVQQVRKRKKISQSRLAEISNVSLGSIKRFENSGNISLISLTRICIALGCEKQLCRIFEDTSYSSIEEVLNDKVR